MLINTEQKISLLEIKGLFGNQDVKIPFYNNVLILMGENGTGKTTILNILYHSLMLNYIKLIDLPFRRVTISFVSGNSFTLEKNELEEKVFESLDEDFAEFLNAKFEKQEIDELLFATRKGKNELYALLDNKYHKVRVPRVTMYRELSKWGQFIDEDAVKIISSEISEEILYFPTYRRIEEDLNKLGFSNIKLEDQLLIKFGLSDVERRIEDLTSTINDLSIKWFSKVNGEMLNQLINGIKVTSEMKESLKNQDTLRIVLGRTGENLDVESKERLYHLVSSEAFYNDSKYGPLVYFLSNLIKIYDQQKELDNAIHNFVKACNKYLRVSKKEFKYDESRVELKVYKLLADGREEEVKLNSLSSGEKQIVSLFARLYLDINKEKFIIIFDEPELSLSTDWQSELLPDIMHSQKCSFMFVVTHSPFMFENELDDYARSLEMYITASEEGRETNV